MENTNTTETAITLQQGYNPFSDEEFAPQEQVQTQVEVAPTATDEPNSMPQSAQLEQSVQEESQSSFDPNQFVKEKFGFDSVEEAENQFKKLKEQPSFEFKDDVSKTLFDAIREGKADDVYQVLNEQKRLEKLTTAELNSDLAVEIVKESIKNKNKDLSQDEIDLLFFEKFYVPLKPEQGYEDSDEDYAQKLQNWQNQVDYVEKRLIIEAKISRPELEKYKAEIKLPDIYNESGRQAESQAEFEMMQKARNEYEKTLNSDFQSFNGFNVSVKDEDVEIPITFNVGEEEKLAMRNELEDFDGEGFLENRWFYEDGKPNVKQIMADKYLLENRDKIFSKIANEAASQRLLAHIKKNGNININQTATPQGSKPDLNSIEAERLRMAEWAFSS